jgi:transcriptional regulator with XRE-family HTH domain
MDSGGSHGIVAAMTKVSAARAEFCTLLREWRKARGLSQLDLALEADVSARNLSFLESGRAQPSRAMTLQLAEALLLPRAATNALLASAGFAAAYPSTSLSAESLAPFRAMLDEMMRRHAPYPALVCDRHWTILDANQSARTLLGPLHDGAGEMNVVRMLCSPSAHALIENMGEVLAEMWGRIRLEALEAGPDPVNDDLLSMLKAAMASAPAPAAAARRPIVPIRLRAAGGALSFLTTIAHFGTSEDITLRDLRLELLFPADEATKRALHALS